VSERETLPAVPPERGLLDNVEDLCEVPDRIPRSLVHVGMVGGIWLWLLLTPFHPLGSLMILGGALLSGMVLLGQRYWFYLRWGRPDLALRAVHSVIRRMGSAGNAADFRLVAASIHFSMNDLLAGKHTLALIDPQELSTPLNRCWYFLLQADLFRRLGDQEGLHAMIDAAEAMDEEDGSGLIRPMIEMARAMEALQRGALDRASTQAASIDPERLSGEGRAHLLNLRAWIEVCREDGDPTRAREWAEEALGYWPGQENIQHTLVCTRLAEGKPAGTAGLTSVARTLEDAERDAPSERRFLYFFAVLAYQRAGDTSRAQECRDLLTVCPGGEDLLARLDAELGGGPR